MPNSARTAARDFFGCSKIGGLGEQKRDERSLFTRYKVLITLVCWVPDEPGLPSSLIKSGHSGRAASVTIRMPTKRIKIRLNLVYLSI